MPLWPALRAARGLKTSRQALNPIRTSRSRFPLTPLALAALAALQGTAWAQPMAPVDLKPTPTLREDIPEEVRNALEFIWLEKVDDAAAQALTPDAPDESEEG